MRGFCHLLAFLLAPMLGDQCVSHLLDGPLLGADVGARLAVEERVDEKVKQFVDDGLLNVALHNKAELHKNRGVCTKTLGGRTPSALRRTAESHEGRANRP